MDLGTTQLVFKEMTALQFMENHSEEASMDVKTMIKMVGRIQLMIFLQNRANGATAMEMDTVMNFQDFKEMLARILLVIQPLIGSAV